MNKIFNFLIFASFLLIISCKQKGEFKTDTIEIDFSKIEERPNLNEKEVYPEDFKVAISAITFNNIEISNPKLFILVNNYKWIVKYSKDLILNV